MDKPITVASVNGPAVTLICGSPSGNRTPLRCAYLTNGAVLAGFTLTNGTASTDQGPNNGQGGGAYGQSAAATVTNCLLTGNSAAFGGGAYQGTLRNCTLVRNSAASLGGGTYNATLYNCGLALNTAAMGGGASTSTLNNCTVTDNSAQAGGGAYEGALNNCIVYYNQGGNFSGGAVNYCCTTPLPSGGTGNLTLDPQLASAYHLSAASPCRGAGSTNYSSGADLDGEAWANPPSIGCDEYWSGAITGALSASISADYTNLAPGFTVNLTGTILGRASASVWDFGDGTGFSNRLHVSHAWTNGGDHPVVLTAYNADYPAGVSGTLTLRAATQAVFYVALACTNPVAPYADWTTAATDIQSAIDVAVLPGQSVLVSNGLYLTGGRPYGTTTTNRVTIPRAMRVSSVNGPEVTLIQGLRGSGGGLGPTAVRCVYLGHGAVLEGFTLTNGATASNDGGGGVYGAGTDAIVTNCVLTRDYGYLGGAATTCTLNNCILWGNSAYRYGGATYYCNLNNCPLGPNGANINGGGACYGTLNNCILTNNIAEGNGGGSYYSTLNNCILSGNDAENGAGAYYGTLSNCTLVANGAWTTGGGSYQSTLYNCIVYSNYATTALNYYGGSLNYCCTIPSPGPGAGNITNVPLLGGIGFHLQPTSPCINAGRNAYAPSGPDLDGNPRISGGTVDMGAYEFQSPASVLSYAWAQQFGLPTDGSADYTDSDGDGMNNWQEWIAGTDPTNAASALRLQAPAVAPPGLLLRWSSDTNHAYFIQRATSLGGGSSFSVIRTNIPGLPGATSFTDASAPSLPAAFYRVGSGSTNDAAPLSLQPVGMVAGSVTLTWSSVTNRSYSVERATSLGASPAFSLLRSNIAGQSGTTSFTDTNAVSGPPPFYRVRVE